MDIRSCIYVAGHRGLVGAAIVRKLQAAGFGNLLLRPREALDLGNQECVDDFFHAHRPEYVFLAAARVGGIQANATRPAEFIHENLMIQSNVIHAAWKHGVRKLLFLGSSCIYPREAAQPISEDALLSGKLESTNRAYAIAKIAGIEMCQAYYRQYGFPSVCLMPTNLYGPQDNFNLESAHVLPALLRKFHEAKEHGTPSLTVWGSGTPRREFLYVDDLADAALFLMSRCDAGELVNVGMGEDITIAELCEMIRGEVGYSGSIQWDRDMPDGTARKLLDISRLTGLGWRPKIGLTEGIRRTYSWYCSQERTDASADTRLVPPGEMQVVV